MKEELKTLIETCLEEMKNELQLEELPRVHLEIPKRENQGDYSSPVAMVIGSMTRQSPRKIAELIFKRLPSNPMVEKIEIAGPGYLNFTFKNSYWHDVLREIVQKNTAYGHSQKGNGIKVQVEFVSANPTGPLHVGHGRGAVVGDALANLLEMTGHQVQREYYINDVGRQVELLGQSTYARYLQLKGEKTEIPAEGYQGEYITEIAREIISKKIAIPEKETEIVPFFIVYSKSQILSGIKKDLDTLHVYFSDWFSEKELYDTGVVNRILEELRKKGLLYEHEGGTWFATTRFGDDKDRIVIKSGGEKTYYASDIAYHYQKYQRGFDRVINIWGADHHGYILRVKAAVEALGFDHKTLNILLLQLVNLLREGKPVPMSKRAGEYVTLRDVFNEVGVDSTRFFFLTRGSDNALDFDLELAKKQSNENPVYYIQYAHARICSVLRNAEEKNIDLSDREVTLSLLTLPQETALMKHLAYYPMLIEECAEAMEPHRVSFYIQDLAGLLHQYYYKTRILSDDLALTRSRLYLTRAIRIVLKNALGVLGISAPEKM
ncbi:MAG: arginine--tRNA ligase [Nitrospiria bacterium]